MHIVFVEVYSGNVNRVFFLYKRGVVLVYLGGSLVNFGFFLVQNGPFFGVKLEDCW